MGVVDAGLQWAWTTLVQIDRVRRHEAALVGRLVEPVEVSHEDRRASRLGLRSDTEFCLVALSNLVDAADLLAPKGDGLPESVVDAVRTLRAGLPSRPRQPSRRRRGRPATRPEVVDLRDDPQRWTLDPSGTRIGGLGLDDLGDAARTLLDFFADLERDGYRWSGWADASA